MMSSAAFPRDGSSFAGRRVLVTGGTSGIGFALARAWRERGAVVAIAGRDPASVEPAAAELSRVPPAADGDVAPVRGYAADLADAGQTADLAARVLADAGGEPPDVLVNNAGFAVYRAFEESSPAEIEALLAVNLLSAVRLTRALLPGMIARRSGAVVNVASIAGRLPLTPCGTYTAAKHGLVAWSECLRGEVARFGVQVNVVCPGRVLTPFFDHETFQRRATRPEARMTVPMDRVVAGTLAAVARNRPVAYIPGHLALFAWAKHALPFAVNPLWNRLVRARIEALYSAREPADSPRP